MKQLDLNMKIKVKFSYFILTLCFLKVKLNKMLFEKREFKQIAISIPFLTESSNVFFNCESNM